MIFIHSKAGKLSTYKQLSLRLISVTSNFFIIYCTPPQLNLRGMRTSCSDCRFICTLRSHSLCGSRGQLGGASNADQSADLSALAVSLGLFPGVVVQVLLFYLELEGCLFKTQGWQSIFTFGDLSKVFHSQLLYVTLDERYLC